MIMLPLNITLSTTASVVVSTGASLLHLTYPSCLRKPKKYIKNKITFSRSIITKDYLTSRDFYERKCQTLVL